MRMKDEDGTLVVLSSWGRRRFLESKGCSRAFESFRRVSKTAAAGNSRLSFCSTSKRHLHRDDRASGSMAWEATKSLKRLLSLRGARALNGSKCSLRAS